MSEKDRREAGITPAFIRFSVGTEDVDDIIGDLAQALAKLPDELVAEHNEKLEIKVREATAKMEAGEKTMRKIEYTDADINTSRSNVPLSLQTLPGHQEVVVPSA
ncbi:hypothetical protein ACHAP8_012140 [Fusarium lateritium]